MASPVGGQFIFSAGDNKVSLSLNDGSGPIQTPVEGNFNIEVFTAPSLTTLPTLDPGFQAGVLDPNATIDSAGFLTGTNLTLFGGDYAVSDRPTGFNTPAVITLGSGNQAVKGTIGDTLVGGTGNQVLNTAFGSSYAIGGTGSYTVYGAGGDTIVGPTTGTTSATTAQILGSDAMLVVPSNGNYTVTGGSRTTAAPGPANVQLGAGNDVIDLTGNTGHESLLLGINATVTAGGGSADIFAIAGDIITFGTGSQYADATAGSIQVNVGAGGSDTIVGGPNDTITGGGANVRLPYLGPGSIVDFAAQTGAVGGINATAGNIGATLGAGSGVSVFGGVGDTVSFGSAGNYADATAGGMLINVGSGGVDTVVGAAATGAGDTIVGGPARLVYDIGMGGDLLNLAGSTGNDTINAFGIFSNGVPSDLTAANDTIIACNGNDSVWGGGGDRIGVGATTPGGIHTWDHSTTVLGASVAFGTNDSAAGTSSARVTVTNFNSVTDTVFYAGRGTSNQDAAIIGTATSSGGNTTVTLPDGTRMTFIGLASAATLKFTS